MKTQICDCCDEEWELTFFCGKCSSKMEFVEAILPKLNWQGVGDGFEEGEEGEEEEEVNTGDVCMNCCNCHLR